MKRFRRNDYLEKRAISDFTRGEFLDFIKFIGTAPGKTEAENDRWVTHFDKLVYPDPRRNRILFWPEPGKDSPEKMLEEVERFRLENNLPGFKDSVDARRHDGDNLSGAATTPAYATVPPRLTKSEMIHSLEVQIAKLHEAGADMSMDQRFFRAGNWVSAFEGVFVTDRKFPGVLDAGDVEALGGFFREGGLSTD